MSDNLGSDDQAGLVRRPVSVGNNSDRGGVTKHVAHHANEQQRPGITHPVVDPVGILTRSQDTLISQYRQMLGNVALGGTNLFDDILYADFTIAQGG